MQHYGLAPLYVCGGITRNRIAWAYRLLGRSICGIGFSQRPFGGSGHRPDRQHFVFVGTVHPRTVRAVVSLSQEAAGTVDHKGSELHGSERKWKARDHQWVWGAGAIKFAGRRPMEGPGVLVRPQMLWHAHPVISELQQAYIIIFEKVKEDRFSVLAYKLLHVAASSASVRPP